VDAWAVAVEPEKAVRFATAEGIRWLEWGMRSYQSFLLGAALVLTGAVVVGARRVSRPIGYLMALSGLAYLAQGWIIGAQGFSPANTIPTLAGIVLILAWSVWLLLSAWFGKDLSSQLTGSRGRSGGSERP
jgi:thiosulfate reductase cytochrome b subunit